MALPARRLEEFKDDALFWASRAFNKGWNRPDWVSVNLTLKCNLSCTFCKTCYPVRQELSTREIKDIVDQIWLWGVKRFNPIGGEPFVRPDLEEILAYACDKDFYITLTTNGTLITPKRAAKIAQIAYNRLHFNFSIDGPNPWHDIGRGAGNFDKVVRGYWNLREADAQAGNPTRKVTVNCIINNHNLSDLPDFLLWCRDELGVQWMQFLNLFRHGDRIDPDIAALWIPESRLDELDRFADFLAGYAEHESDEGFRIANTVEDLQNIKKYYRGELEPLDGQCWSGWKELYINADGTAIMCDGKLDFLNGAFGDIRKQTLRELWTGDEIRALRENVRACQTPCIQDCYLRRRSDSALRIARGIGRLVYDELRNRYTTRREAWPVFEDSELTLQLSDVLDVGTFGAKAPPERLRALCRPSPESFASVRGDPFRFYELRNTGALDFGRGFLDFANLKAVIEEAQAHDQHYGIVRLGWVGEPLLHPQVEEILRWLAEAWLRKPFARWIEIPTNATLLNHNYARITAEAGDVPFRWRLAVDAWDHDSYLLHHDEPLWLRVLDNANFLFGRHQELKPRTQQVIVECRVSERTAAHVQAFHTFWTGHLAGYGFTPELSTWSAPLHPGVHLRLVHDDAHTDDAMTRARAHYRQALATMQRTEAEPDSAARRTCSAFWKTPTISWDGKVLLCTEDAQHQQRVGDLGANALADLWWKSPRAAQLRKQALREDWAGLPLCRGCVRPYHPDAPAIGADELVRIGARR